MIHYSARTLPTTQREISLPSLSESSGKGWLDASAYVDCFLPPRRIPPPVPAAAASASASALPPLYTACSCSVAYAAAVRTCSDAACLWSVRLELPLPAWLLCLGQPAADELLPASHSGQVCLSQNLPPPDTAAYLHTPPDGLGRAHTLDVRFRPLRAPPLLAAVNSAPSVYVAPPTYTLSSCSEAYAAPVCTVAACICTSASSMST